jgi:DNA replication licensing factor MCM4
MGGYDTPMGLQSPGSPAPNRALLDNEEGANAVIWGTTVCVRTCIDVFSLFLHDFTLEDQFEAFYEKELHRMQRTQEWVLNLNVRHLFSYRPSAKLAKQLIEYPHEVIPIMDNVVNSEYIRMFGETDLGANKIQVRTYNLGKVQRMRALDPTHIDQLISIKGMIVRGTAIIPDLKQVSELQKRVHNDDLAALICP